MDCFEAVKVLLGVCVERRLDLGNAILTLLGIAGLISILIAVMQFRQGLQAQKLQASALRARFVLDLHKEFLSNDDERNFFYKLDYGDFKFDPKAFPQSEDERQLDRLLYKLSYVGKLLRDRLVTLADINNVRYIASSALRNDEVLAYLKWLKKVQVPDHSSFSDAVFLFERMFGRNDPAYRKILAYLSPPR